MDPIIISPSQNISLYPALVGKSNEDIVCAWYEYTSPDYPTRSDIWCSITKNGIAWSDPFNVSGKVSYNNGPSLICRHVGSYMIAWHSWRKPGKEPFSIDGDVSNIWLAESEDGRTWTSPVMPITCISSTKYAMLAQGTADSVVWLFFEDRTNGKLCFIKSKNLKRWSEPLMLPDIITHGKQYDVAVDWNGTIYLVFASETDKIGLWLIKSKDGMHWSDPKLIFSYHGLKLARPRISIDEMNRIWVSCHSEAWGSYAKCYRLRVLSGKLNLTFSSEKTPGNACWAVNAVHITCMRTGQTKFFTFGPDIFSFDSPAIKVTEEDCVYRKEKGYGFNGQVKCILRELGDSITRTLFYDEEPKTFSVDLPDGEYEIRIIYSSWIASTPGTLVNTNAEVLSFTESDIRSDAVFVCCLVNGICVYERKISPDSGYDHNRPSRIISSPWDDRKFIAWTSYGPKSVNIVLNSFAEI